MTRIQVVYLTPYIVVQKDYFLLNISGLRCLSDLVH